MAKPNNSRIDSAELARLIESKVYEAMKGADADFQPFFQPQQVSHEIRARQTVIERERFTYFYEDYGCLRCETKERPHLGMGMCEPCYGRTKMRIRASLQKRLDAVGQPEEFIDSAALARQAVLPSLPRLIYDTGNLLPAETTEKYRTMREAAAEVGVGYMTLHHWVRFGKVGRGSVMLNKKSVLWNAQDMDRLRKFVCENASFQASRRTSAEAARQVGMSHRTLEHWVRDGKIRPSLSRGRVRYWSDDDIERLRATVASRGDE